MAGASSDVILIAFDKEAKYLSKRAELKKSLLQNSAYCYSIEVSNPM